MKSGSVRRAGTASGRRRQAGFTMLEMVITVAIGIILTLIAVPLMQNVRPYFKLRGAVSEISAAIQSTRYQAIFQGCPYQIAFNAAAKTYQISAKLPTVVAGVSQCGAAYVNQCIPATLAACPITWAESAGPVTLNADATLTFLPNGSVTPTTLVVTYPGRAPMTIQVSTYGNITFPQ